MTQESVCGRRVPSGRRRWAVLGSAVTLIIVGLAVATDRYGGANRAAAEAPRSGQEPGGQMTVTGRVLDADGNPVAGCQMALLTQHFRRSVKPEGTWPLGHHPGLAPANKVAVTGQTDAEGRFRLVGPGYSAALPTTAAAVIASAPGHGLAAQGLDFALARHELTVKLRPERVVRGRLVDPEGKPAAGVEVRVHIPPHVVDDLRGLHWTRAHSTLRRVFGIWCYTPPEGPFWPKPVVTDEQGRFLVRRLGMGKATLEARSDRTAPNRFDVQTVAPHSKEEVILRLESAPLLEGRVTEEGNGKPVVGARLVVMTDALKIVEARTDKEGRYAVRPFPAAWKARPHAQGRFFQVIAHPPEGSPYLVIREKDIAMADKDRQELKLSLPVGVVVRGRVTEAGSGKPVAGARVQYRQRNADNPLLRKGAAHLPYTNTLFLEEGDDGPVSTLETAISGVDGRFQLAVAPGPGHLFLLGPTLDYVPVETTLRELEGGQPGAFRYYPHAVVALDLKPGAAAREVAATLRRGVTAGGRVVGQDGKPSANFMVLCRSYIPSGWHQWNNTSLNWLEGRDGIFELPGCDPDKVVTAYFWDAGNGLGATVELPVKQDDRQSTTVRLEPCGKAEVSCVGLDGKPLADHSSAMFFQFDPGTVEPLNFYCADRALESNWVPWGRYGPTDAEGKANIANLIPGATYLLEYSMKTKESRGSFDRFTQAFTVKSGKTVQVRVVQDNRPRAVPYVDLQPKANHNLKETFDKSLEGNDLAELKPGNRTFHGGFNIGAGFIRLANMKLQNKLPEKVTGIKVDAKLAYLHVLHATGYTTTDDTVVARYIVYYDDKSEEAIEVVYGKDVRDWWRRKGDKAPARGKVAWEGSNEAAKAAGHSIWLFHLTWKNPYPDKKVLSIDLVSTLTEAAPFVVAMTHTPN